MAPNKSRKDELSKGIRQTKTPQAVLGYFAGYITKADSLTNEFYRRLKRLLTAYEMKIVWRELAEFTDEQLKFDNQSALMVNTAALIFELPRRYKFIKPPNNRLGKSKTKFSKPRHLERISALANKLSDAISYQYPVVSIALEKNYPRYQEAYTMLLEIATLADSLRGEKLSSNAHQGNEIFSNSAKFKKMRMQRAPVIYFTRELSNYFRRVTGKPMHAVVANAACAMFPEHAECIDEHTVQKNTADLNLD